MMNEEEKARFDKLIADSEQVLEDYIKQKRIKNSSTEWLTVAEYCKKFNIPSTQIVTTWISRGVIPKENVFTISEVNNRHLIKAEKYEG